MKEFQQFLQRLFYFLSIAAVAIYATIFPPASFNWDELLQLPEHTTNEELPESSASVTLEDIPPYSGSPYVCLYENAPDFSGENRTYSSFEDYSPLDLLGRCGVAYANISPELMPTEKRGPIGQVKPSGWKTVRYDGLVDGNYLYNRCHLIGFQLTGENANERNLITGTRYLNVEGMLPFENMVADYVEDTGNHVLYRVTPIYDGTDLVASGVQMEALSVEDGGTGVKFNIYVYNVQPGVEIDYATGNSWLADQPPALTDSSASGSSLFTYVLNTKSGKFHDPGCSGADTISEENREVYTGQREDLISRGFDPCGQCQP